MIHKHLEKLFNWRIRKKRNICFVFFGFYVISYLMLCGIVSPLNLSSVYIGYGEAVMWSNLFWWFGYALFELGVNPLNLTNWFYPLELTIFDGSLPMLVFSPVTYLGGSILSYNLYVLTCFSLSGTFTFLLGRFLKLSTLASLFAGLTFTLSSKHFLHSSGHLHTYSAFGIPLVVLLYLKFLKKATWGNCFLLSIVAASTALTSWLVALVSGVLVAILFVVDKPLRKPITFHWKLFISIIGAVVLASPGIFAMLTLSESFIEAKYGFRETLVWSADLLSFFTPPPNHWLLGDQSYSIFRNFSGNAVEATTYLGIVGIIFSAVALIKREIRTACYPWLLILFAFILLSLGPVVHIAGIERFTTADITLTLPTAFIPSLPVFDMVRAVNRYAIGANLAVAVLSGVVFSILINKIENIKLRNLTICLLTSVLIIDSIHKNPRMNAVEVPLTYSKIGEMSLRGSILELPMTRSALSPNGVDTMTSYYEYQKHHGLFLMGGYFARVNPAFERFATVDPVLSKLWGGNSKDIFSVKQKIDPLSYLKTFYNTQFIVVHKNKLEPGEFGKIISLLGNEYEQDKSVLEDSLFVYNLASRELVLPNSVLRCQPSYGWFKTEYWSEQPSRWMEDKSEIIIHSQSNQVVDLSLSIITLHSKCNVKIYINGNLQGLDHANNKDWSQLQLSLPLKKGINSLIIEVPEGGVRPTDVNPNSRDVRQLALSVRALNIISNQDR